MLQLDRGLATLILKRINEAYIRTFFYSLIKLFIERSLPDQVMRKTVTTKMEYADRVARQRGVKDYEQQMLAISSRYLSYD